MPPNNQKAPDFPNADKRSENVFVTAKTNSQFMTTAMALAISLIDVENNSPIIIQGSGPKPSEKQMTNTLTESSGSHPILLTDDSSFSFN